MTKIRPAALFAALLLVLAALVVAGCGGGGSSSSSSSTASEESSESGGGAAEESGGGETLTVGSDIPYPPFEQKEKGGGGYTGFDVEPDGSDRQGDRARTGIHRLLLRNDLPRRRAGQVRSGDVGGDDHRRTRRSRLLLAALLPLRTGDPGQRRQLDHRPRRPQGQSRRRPAGHDRPRTRQGKSRSEGTAALPGRPRRRQRAEGRHGRSGDHRRAGGRNSRPKNSAASKSSKKSRPKKRMESRSRRKRPNCSNRSTKA